MLFKQWGFQLSRNFEFGRLNTGQSADAWLTIGVLGKWHSFGGKHFHTFELTIQISIVINDTLINIIMLNSNSSFQIETALVGFTPELKLICALSEGAGRSSADDLSW